MSGLTLLMLATSVYSWFNVGNVLTFPSWVLAVIDWEPTCDPPPTLKRTDMSRPVMDAVSIDWWEHRMSETLRPHLFDIKTIWGDTVFWRATTAPHPSLLLWLVEPPMRHDPFGWLITIPPPLFGWLITVPHPSLGDSSRPPPFLGKGDSSRSPLPLAPPLLSDCYRLVRPLPLGPQRVLLPWKG